MKHLVTSNKLLNYFWLVIKTTLFNFELSFLELLTLFNYLDFEYVVSKIFKYEFNIYLRVKLIRLE